MFFAPPAGHAADQGRIGGRVPTQGLGPLELSPQLGRWRQARVGMGLEVVVDACVVLGDGSQVRAVLEAVLQRQGGDVFGAGVDVGQQHLVDIAHRGGGARAVPAATATALARPSVQAVCGMSRVGLVCDRAVPVCNGSGSTLF